MEEKAACSFASIQEEGEQTQTIHLTYFSFLYCRDMTSFTILVSFSVAVIKYLVKSNFKEKGFICLTISSYIIVGKSRQGLEASHLHR